jgi:hypothetical protein
MIHSAAVGHLGCFQSLTIVNSAVMNISVQVSEVVAYTYVFQCISYYFLELFQSFKPYSKVFDPL